MGLSYTEGGMACGVELVSNLPALTELDLIGCVNVTDEVMRTVIK